MAKPVPVAAPIAMPIADEIKGDPTRDHLSTGQEAPYSLDDADPLPPKLEPVAGPPRLRERGANEIQPLPPTVEAESVPNTMAHRSPPMVPGPGTRSRPTALGYFRIIVVGLLTLGLMALVFVGFGYFTGQLYSWNWKEVAPHEGQCRLLMLGDPESISEMGEIGSSAEKRFESRLPLSRIHTAIGWFDVAEGSLPFTPFESIAKGERDRRAMKLAGSVVKEGTIKMVVRGKAVEGREYHIESPDEGLVIERLYFVADSPTARIYTLTIWGKNVREDHPAVSKFFNSFQLD
jgi:hypothetical protein